MTIEDTRRDLCNLLSQKRNGTLDVEESVDSNNVKLWRNIVPYHTLERNMHHFDEQIRLNTLALIVESKKSTLKFTEKELQLIISFLQYNLSEKAEYVPVLKKAFKRVKDSLAVMKRELLQEEKSRIYLKQNHKSSNELDKELRMSLDRSNKITMNLSIHKRFFIIVRDLCVSSLCPDATYNKRKSALQLLCLQQEILSHEWKDVKWSSRDAEIIFQCLLLDTYENNKAMAFNILKLMDPTLLRLNDENRVSEILSTALDLANSIRPIDSVTASYMMRISMLSPIIRSVLKTEYRAIDCPENLPEAVTLQLISLLINKLEESLSLAMDNIVLAVTKHSLYGYVFCLRILLNECNFRKIANEKLWQDTIAKVITVCFGLSHAVSLIVNNSSPEGHLPMDLNTRATKNLFNCTHENMPVTAQMVLLCSWRTVKEVSLLFGLLVVKSPIQGEDHQTVELLVQDQVIKIGEHLVTLLCETKHRGAFEQAHVGFHQLCTRLWRLKKSDLNQLPKNWLHQILIAIVGVAQENSKLCATRRSAGVPFMVQALLSSEPRAKKDTKTSTFHSVMRILLGFTELETGANVFEKVNQLLYEDTVFSDYRILVDSFECDIRVTDVKTHAMNILRAIYRNSQLGELVNDYIADGLIASFKSYNAITWAERNAATLLYSALIVRIFGVQRTKDHVNLTTDNKMSGIVFFQRYANLRDFILNQLRLFTVNDLTTIAAMKSNVHPILLLLSRLYLNQQLDAANAYWMTIISYVSECAASPVYETRRLAARVLTSLSTEENSADTLKRLLHSISSAPETRISLNKTHGYMLQVFDLVNRFDLVIYKNIDWNEFLKKTKWIFKNLENSSEEQACFPLAAVYVELLNKLRNDDSEEQLNIDNIEYILLRHGWMDPGKLKYGPQRELYKTAAARYVLSFYDLSQEMHFGLYAGDPELQLVLWPIISEIRTKTSLIEQISIYNHAFTLIVESIKELQNYSPDLQDAMFDFLYDSLGATELPTYVRKVCALVLEEIQELSNQYNFYKRDSYIRLLGKSYVTLKGYDSNDVSEECTDDVYETVCDATWISSLNSSMRNSVFEILCALQKLAADKDYVDCRDMLWWTTILQLLVDDDYQVRRTASEVIAHIQASQTMSCFVETIKQFFNVFLDEMFRSPTTGCALLFYWGMTLLGDTDYEMDETDVFNKCRNHEMFEPLKICRMCVECSETLLSCTLNDAVPEYAVKWIATRMNIDFPKSLSFSSLVKYYKTNVPVLQGSLRDILNPTYKEKLLQIMAYEKWHESIQS